jgi:hypothetical protein
MESVKWLDKHCHVCGLQLNSWDRKASKALAYKNLVCERCIAEEYDTTPEELRATLEEVFGLRPCMGI